MIMNKIKAATLKPLALASFFVLSSTTGLAQDSTAFDLEQLISKQEQDNKVGAGFFGGGAVGGLIAGPPGAIAGIFIGTLLSDGHNTQEENKNLQANINNGRAALIALQDQQTALEELYLITLAEKQNSELIAAQLREDSMQDLADFTLHFKTNSSSIENHYQEQLTSLAQIAKGMPNAVIEIDAYSDRRGESSFNLDLSQNRIEEVIKSLQARGISQETIQSKAYGEAQPLSAIETLEDNFFDRRVSVRIRPANTDYITQAK